MSYFLYIYLFVVIFNFRFITVLINSLASYPFPRIIEDNSISSFRILYSSYYNLSSHQYFIEIRCPVVSSFFIEIFNNTSVYVKHFRYTYWHSFYIFCDFSGLPSGKYQLPSLHKLHGWVLRLMLSLQTVVFHFIIVF